MAAVSDRMHLLSDFFAGEFRFCAVVPVNDRCTAPDPAEKVCSGEMALDRVERIIRDREAEQRRIAHAPAGRMLVALGSAGRLRVPLLAVAVAVGVGQGEQPQCFPRDLGAC